MQGNCVRLKQQQEKRCLDILLSLASCGREKRKKVMMAAFRLWLMLGRGCGALEQGSQTHGRLL